MQAEKKPLPVASPERAGLPSQAVEAYVRALDGERLALHSLLIARKGQLIFEGYWKPMDADFRHRLYSCSKSFVSCAVGLLIEQGLCAWRTRPSASSRTRPRKIPIPIWRA